MARKTTRSGRGKSTRGNGPARGGLANSVQPDAKLAPIVGKDPITRAELTRRVWDYVKANDLQDPDDRRTICADAKLKPVFGGKERVSMFEMTRLVNKHVTGT